MLCLLLVLLVDAADEESESDDVSDPSSESDEDEEDDDDERGDLPGGFDSIEVVLTVVICLCRIKLPDNRFPFGWWGFCFVCVACYLFSLFAVLDSNLFRSS